MPRRLSLVTAWEQLFWMSSYNWLSARWSLWRPSQAAARRETGCWTRSGGTRADRSRRTAGAGSETTLAWCQEAGGLAGAAAGLRRRGGAAQGRGESATATTRYEQSLTRGRQLDARAGLAMCLDGLGEVARRGGECERGVA